jgi:hypothetical protein
VFGLLLVSALLRPWEIHDADVFWHLATGRWILGQHAIPRTDPFSFTAADRPWIDHEWLFQLLLRSLQVAGSVTLLYCSKVILYSLAVVLPAWYWARRSGVVPAAAAAALAMFAALPFSEYRPIMLSIVLLAVTVCATDAAVRARKWPLLVLPLVFAVWANVHATFALGLVAIGCTLLLPARKYTPGVTRRPRLLLLLLLVLATVATLLNPYGWRVWGVPGSVLRSALFLRQNQEWRRPDASPIFWAFYVQLFMLVVAIARERIRALCGDVLFALTLGIAACFSRRIIPYFAIAAIAPIALGLTPATVAVQVARTQRRAHEILLFVFFLVGATWAALVCRTHEVQLTERDGLSFLDGAFPLTCVERLREYRPAGNLVNDYNHGGFLHYEVGPAWKVYIDGRNDLYGERLTQAYNNLANATGEWRQELTARHIDAALISYDMCMQRPNLATEFAANASWALVEFDDAGMLFVRRALADARWIDTHQYQVVKPMFLYEELRDQYSAQKQFPLLIAELQRRCEQSRCRIAELTLVQALADSGRTEDALKVLDAEEQFYHPDELSRSIRTQLSPPQ